MESFWCFALALAVFLVGVVASLVGRLLSRGPRRDVELRRKAARTPRRAITELREGQPARVEGTAERGEGILRALVTGRECLACRVDVFVAGASRHRLFVETRSVAFWLTKGDERLRIESGDVELLPFEDHYERGGPLEPLSSAVKELLERHGESLKTPSGQTRQFEIFETILVDGDTMGAAGRVRFDRVHEAGEGASAYREAPDLSAHLEAPEGGEIILFTFESPQYF